MEIIERGVLPDGTHVQLESWKGNHSSLTIGAYPIARRAHSPWLRLGERFRLQISSNHYAGYTDEMVRLDYSSLLTGEKSLCDLSSHF